MSTFFFLVLVVFQLTSLLGHPTTLEDSNAYKDMDTAETFWDVFNRGGGRGYSGWGTGPQSQVNPISALGTYGSFGQNYGNPAYGTYGSYGNYGGTYGTYSPNGYYGKYPLYAGYTGQQPTYENYAIHGGHGFGKYGNLVVVKYLKPETVLQL